MQTTYHVCTCDYDWSKKDAFDHIVVRSSHKSLRMAVVGKRRWLKYNSGPRDSNAQVLASEDNKRSFRPLDASEKEQAERGGGSSGKR